jgi:hypothetical protein
LFLQISIYHSSFLGVGGCSGGNLIAFVCFDFIFEYIAGLAGGGGGNDTVLVILGGGGGGGRFFLV